MKEKENATAFYTMRDNNTTYDLKTVFKNNSCGYIIKEKDKYNH